jgi:ubiquinone/menaquinone biosynthesis C-methylase UbiE
VIGADQNLHELKQAARVFSSNPNVAFLDVDIFSAPFASETFDMILLASAIQYFSDLPALLNTLFQYLKPQGEIHIIDSPLYTSEEIPRAMQRSGQYYASLGFPEMVEQYFHHCVADLGPFDPQWLFRPGPRSLRQRLLRTYDPPFPWLVINKQTVQRDVTISEAFSRTAKKYDAFADDHPHLTRMRSKVYAHIERFVPKDARILELNCGTGIDAVALAQRGYTVHATDNAPGMLNQLPEKIASNNVGEKVTCQQCSFTELDQIQGAPFDAIFSDLGGLNCIPDLSPVIRQLPKVLRPGGLVTWVLMPTVCLWELAEIFRGHPHLAFRRFARNGTRAHLEELNFTVYYFTPQQALQWFGNQYDCLSIEGLSIITPTAESKNFAKRYKRLYRTLSWLDDRVAFLAPWRGWGDFFIITMRYQPK